MLYKLAILFAIVAVASAITDEEHREFVKFQSKYNKVYQSKEHAKLAEETFADNLKKINEHNARYEQKLETFTLGVNKFADLTQEQFAQRMNGLKKVVRGKSQVGLADRHASNPAPESVNWLDVPGVVADIKDQGQCGSCWAFSAIASTESAIALSLNKTVVPLSEQNIMDCSWRYGNEGCNGGLMDQAFQYIVHNFGVDTEASYPYTARSSNRCRYKSKTSGGSIHGYFDVASGDEIALEMAVAQKPTSVAIDASSFKFQMYSGGVYNNPDCSSVDLDHGVVAVGYGTENNQKYWLVRNSWGSDWGEAGYIKMSRDKNNQCGIATDASYPIV